MALASVQIVSAPLYRSYSGAASLQRWESAERENPSLPGFKGCPLDFL